MVRSAVTGRQAVPPLWCVSVVSVFTSLRSSGSRGFKGAVAREGLALWGELESPSKNTKMHSLNKLEFFEIGGNRMEEFQPYLHFELQAGRQIILASDGAWCSTF
jgi:hypothetical protein